MSSYARGKAIELLNENLFEVLNKRIEKLKKVIDDMDTEQIYKLRLETCVTSGHVPKFQDAKKRKGRCAQIGYVKTDGVKNQIWAVWN